MTWHISHLLAMLESFSESSGALPKAAASSSAKLVIVCTQLSLVNFIQFSISFRFFLHIFQFHDHRCWLPKTQMSTLKKARHFEARRNFLGKIDTQPFLKNAIPLWSFLFHSIFSSYCCCNWISCLPKILVLPSFTYIDRMNKRLTKSN